MEQRIGSNSQPLEGAAVDPAFVPGLTGPAPAEPKDAAVRETASDGETAPEEETAPEKRTPAEQPNLEKEAAEEEPSEDEPSDDEADEAFRRGALQR